jgi:hypothetical protein
MTLSGVDPSLYNVTFYNGNVNGTLFFTLFVTDDYFKD